jgi:malto-oligosyltrehalose trehalohydrolase
MPFGCELDDGGVRFRFFAPAAEQVRLELNAAAELLPMQPCGNGWHELCVPNIAAGARYRFVLPDGLRVADPASRFQPEDVSGPSEMIDSCAYRWSDAAWKGRAWSEAVLYELHVGAFTPEGTFRGAIERLEHLQSIGVTGIELMALADFRGARNWGYDGVLLYAPDSVYGRPEDLKALVDAAHERGIMVLLDVVYNHVGREGNVLPKYWPQFLSPIHDTPWGKPPNFDAEGSCEVREFIVHNALYWIEEFHLDGLRLDASHDMRDTGTRHILDELAERLHAAAGDRQVHLVLEDEHNASDRLMRDFNGRPSLYSAQWNHQMAHLRELAEEKEAARQGGLDKLTKTVAKMVGVGYGGTVQASNESDAIDCSVPPTAYISFLQTHDLVGNDLTGERAYAKAPLRINRALSAIYLLVPQIPMLFMGDEWGASTPFAFFCDFGGDMAESIRKGRREFVKKELHLDDAALERMPDPLSPQTFLDSHLNWNELTEPVHADWLDWYRRILTVRRERVTPLLRGVCERCGDYKLLSPGAFIAHWTLDHGAQLALDANLCDHPADGFSIDGGETLWLEGEQETPARLAPWSVRWSLRR